MIPHKQGPGGRDFLIVSQQKAARLPATPQWDRFSENNVAGPHFRCKVCAFLCPASVGQYRCETIFAQNRDYELFLNEKKNNLWPTTDWTFLGFRMDFPLESL
ncbi:hypothetical protein EVAR_5988_1 [Eumeta japonica]|uniref:Uncharacterized protein n=1 Tax=Eumeta variegata TaxID=151549 RepID=A0A4C1T9N3_EUMVA|nr:hypothetical protein EVAR_5988_1 [Eumeta japonica]